MSSVTYPIVSIAVGGKYTGELKEIARILNSWQLSELPQFNASNDLISFSRPHDEDEELSIVPRRILLFMPSGPQIYKDLADPETIEAACYEEEGDDVPLRTISERISPYLHSGAIEIYNIAVFPKGKETGGYFERLQICADGLVEQQFFNCDLGKPAECIREVYDPLTSTHPNFRAYLH